jgi:hypothetical protein
MSKRKQRSLNKLAEKKRKPDEIRKDISVEESPQTRTAPSTAGPRSLIRFHEEFTAPRKEGTIDAETKKWAAFADTSYQSGRRNRQRALRQHSGLNQEDLADWIYEEDFSNKFTSVFVNHETKQVVTSFRGTKGIEDLPADVAIAFGHPGATRRFQQAVLDYEEILDSYTGFDHILSSHSLGGSLNNFVNEVHRDRVHQVHNFNPGSGVAAVLGGLHDTVQQADYSNVHSYYVHGDPISTLGQVNQSHNVHHVKCLEGTVNCHSLAQFYT